MPLHQPAQVNVARMRALLDDPQMAGFTAGHHPGVTEARDRLELLRIHGESPRAFTFRRLYPAPDVGKLTSD